MMEDSVGMREVAMTALLDEAESESGARVSLTAQMFCCKVMGDMI